MIETLVQRIIRHEGFCATPKYDAKGCYEVGYGHDITPDDVPQYAAGISTDDATTLLEADLTQFKQDANSAFPWLLGLDDTRQGIIYEMVYQMGVNGVAAFTQMIAAIRIQDWASAATQMLNSDWHKETPARCEELANLMLNEYNTDN